MTRPSPTPPRPLAFLALALALTLPTGCGEPQGPPPAAGLPAAPYDLDGRPRGDLPRIHAWCVAVILSDHASLGIEGVQKPVHVVVPTPERWPNVASLLTGLLPSQHGVGADGAAPSGYARAWITAAEVLRGSYGYETVAFQEEAWPAATAPLLQGFENIQEPGAAVEQVHRWQASRDASRPWFALLDAPTWPREHLWAALRAAAGASPLLLLALPTLSESVPAGSSPGYEFHDASVLTPLRVESPPGCAPWPDGASLASVLDEVLARLGAPPIPGEGRSRVDRGGTPLARLDWATPTRVTTGVRGPGHTYGVIYDLPAGTVEEFLLRQDGSAPVRSSDGPLPTAGLDPAFCAAVESVRDRLWRQVDDVRWRVESGYASGIPSVQSPRPPPLCAPPR